MSANEAVLPFKPSRLDLIFTNEEGMIDTIEHNAPLGNSDHETLEPLNCTDGNLKRVTG